MNLMSILQQLGLKERESEVYLALLELGEASVQEIARKAKLQRPNCYVILESLAKQGLVSFQVKGNGRRFAAEDPDRLLMLLKEKEQLLASVLPQLKSLHNLAPGKPRVRFYEGKEMIDHLYEEILRGEWYDCLYAPESVTAVWGSGYVTNFGRKSAERGMRVRELIAGTDKNPPYASHYHSPQQEIRFLPPSAKSSTDFILFANKVALVAYEPEIHALVVEDSGIIQTLQLMFNSAWAEAKRAGGKR
jgi:sugar-specific transcriptional regulator TrmB